MTPISTWLHKTFPKVSADSSSWLRVQCPFCSKHKLNVSPDSGGAKCWACTWAGNVWKLAAEAKLDPSGLPQRKEKADWNPSDLGQPVAEWIYSDPLGTRAVLKVVRYEQADGTKTYRPQHPDGKGGWRVGGLPKNPLYHADRLASAGPDTIVWVTEGEKCADWVAGVGLLSTTAPEGAGKFNKVATDYLELLRGRHVVVLPDNDEPGRRHAGQVVQVLGDRVASIKILALPGLVEKADVADWLQAGGSAAALLELEAATPIATAEIEPVGRILLQSKDAYDLEEVAAEALRALIYYNRPPTILSFNGRLVRVEGDEPVPLNLASLRGVLARAAAWATRTKNGEQPCPPPSAVVQDILALPSYPRGIPPLHAVLTLPTVARDGRLLTTNGYHADSGVWLALPSDLQGLDVPNNPTANDIKEALETLTAPFVDFPFVADSDRALAIAACIQPLGRESIDGPTPFYLAKAPAQGTGKDLLLECICLFSTPEQSWPADDEPEQRKRLMTILKGANPYVRLANLKGELDSATLEGVLTSVRWRDRTMATHQKLDLVNLCTWLGSANQLRLSEDMARRTQAIRLDARVEQPSLRAGWRIPDLKEFLREQQRARVAAGLTLWLAWHRAGRPLWRGTVPGSFETWGRVLGGVLQVANVPGWLAGWARTLERQAADQRDQVRAFVACWLEELHNPESRRADSKLTYTAAELMDALCQRRILANGDSAAPCLPDILAQHHRSHAQKVAVGRLLAAHEGRIYHINGESFAISRSGCSRNGSTLWELESHSQKRDSAETPQHSLPIDSAETPHAKNGSTIGVAYSEESEESLALKFHRNSENSTTCDPRACKSKGSPEPQKPLNPAKSERKPFLSADSVRGLHKTPHPLDELNPEDIP